MGSRAQLVLATFVEMADTLATDYDVGEFLQTLVERCGEVLEVGTGGVLVEGSEGSLQLAAATSHRMKELEDLEISLGQGPCIDAYRRVEQVLAVDLRVETERWPEIAEKAVEMGLRAAYAFPMRLRDDCIGALNLYREETGPFQNEDIRLAQAFADVATIGILQRRRVADAEQRSEQLRGALTSRVMIERANGILAERYSVSPDRAFAAIRHHARSHNRRLRDVCQEILDGGDPVRP